MGTKLFFYMPTKNAGAMSTVFSKLLSSQNEGEFDTLVLLRQQDHGKKAVCMCIHTHTHIQTHIWIFLYEYRGSLSNPVRASQLQEGPRK